MISSPSQSMNSPSGSLAEGLIVPDTISRYHLGSDPSMVMKQRQLADTLGAISAGTAHLVRLEPVLGG